MDPITRDLIAAIAKEAATEARLNLSVSVTNESKHLFEIWFSDETLGKVLVSINVKNHESRESLKEEIGNRLQKLYRTLSPD